MSTRRSRQTLRTFPLTTRQDSVFLRLHQRTSGAQLKFFKALIGILLAAACTIAFLAMTDGYERTLRAPAKEARVLEVKGSAVRYELHSPGSPWDKDGDGWVGPYVDEDVPEAKRATLTKGAPLVVREGKLELSLAPPTKLLLVGILLGIAFTIWTFVGPILDARALKRAAANPQQLFELMLRKTRTTKILAGLLLVAISAPIAAVAAIVEAKLWERVFLVGLGGVGVLFGLVVLYGAWELRNISQAPLMRLLRDEPRRIIWVYEYRLVVNDVPNYNIYVCCDDGQRFEFNLAQWDPAPLIDVLAKQLPHAAFGYSEVRLKAFQASPQNFLAQKA